MKLTQPIRAIGTTGAPTRATRVARADAAAASRVGADDITAWLHTRRALGDTLIGLAAATGRSVPWVRARIAGTTTTGSGTDHPSPLTIAVQPACQPESAPSVLPARNLERLRGAER